MLEAILARKEGSAVGVELKLKVLGRGIGTV